MSTNNLNLHIKPNLFPMKQMQLVSLVSGPNIDKQKPDINRCIRRDWLGFYAEILIIFCDSVRVCVSVE